MLQRHAVQKLHDEERRAVLLPDLHGFVQILGWPPFANRRQACNTPEINAASPTTCAVLLAHLAFALIAKVQMLGTEMQSCC